MIKEEKWMLRCIGALSAKGNHRVLRKAFREAIRAVREDCAKVTESFEHERCAPDLPCTCEQCAHNRRIVAAIRRKGK
jgi:hypothetical protein